MTDSFSDNRNNCNNSNNHKIIKHGEWSFEIDPNANRKNIFTTTIESFDNNMFELYRDDYVYNNNYNNLTESDLDDFRRASNIHKIARRKALSLLYTGGRIGALVDAVEEVILKLCRQDQKTYFMKGSPKNNMSGIAFPVGVNINNIVAHDSKTYHNNKIDDRTFSKGDLVKVDIGVHINGRIIDSAFSHIVTDKPGINDDENIYNAVMNASKDSMWNAIKLSGPDQRLLEISETISEVIQSYEVDILNLPIKPCVGIGGHNIKKYQIHGGKLILSSPDEEIQGDQKMEDDEIYAIETYATTGTGVMTQHPELSACTHFMECDFDQIEKNKKITKHDKKQFRNTELYKWLKTRNGMPFSSSWLDTSHIPKIEKAMKLGIPSGQLIAYPPLMDENNAVVAQYEHTLHVKENTVEVFSLDTDY